MTKAQVFKTFWRRNLESLQEILRELWPWVIFATGTQDLVSFTMTKLRKSDEHFLVISVLVEVSVSLALQAISVIAINQVIYNTLNNRRVSPWAAVARTFKYYAIESLRALLPILLKSLLLLIPGLIEMARLYFIPYVVQFDKRYQEGKVDGLQRSREYVKGHLILVIITLLLTTGVGILPQMWLSTVQLFDQPAFYIIAFALTVFLQIYTFLVNFNLFMYLYSLQKDAI